MKLFENDKKQKDFLNKVSAVSGIKRASIQKVWEYTIYTMLLDISEDKDAVYNELQIPFLGKVLLKESKDYPGDYDMFLLIFDSIKESIKKIKKNDMRDLIEFFDKNFIEKALENVD